MKHSMMFSQSVKALALSVLVAVLFFINPAQAQEAPKAAGVEITYLGTVNNKPTFQVSFDNNKEEEVFLTLKDAYGNLLYTETVKEKKFSKRFQLNENELDSKMTLVLVSKKDKQPQVFEINRNTRLVEDVVVTKVR